MRRLFIIDISDNFICTHLSCVSTYLCGLLILQIIQSEKRAINVARGESWQSTNRKLFSKIPIFIIDNLIVSLDVATTDQFVVQAGNDN